MSELVTVKIDDREVKVPDGVAIIEAASLAGIDIPHLCYCRCLESTGACRVCLVEVEDTKGLVASCSRKVKDGMVVYTNTDKVKEARRFVIELILSNHPGDCLSCDKNGACELQKYAYELGIEKTGFSMKDPGYAIDDSNPFIERNYNLCILCGRCVRICKLKGADILDFARRGMLTKVTTPLDKSLQESGCDFCGSCLAVCPVGALLEIDRRFRGREWEMKETETTCSYCGCGCGLSFGTVEGEILRATTKDPCDYLCARGRFGWDYVASPERLTTPLIKKEGALTECSWDEALSYAAERLLKLKKEHGPESIGGFIGAGSSNEVIYLFQKFLRACVGTNNVDSSARLLGFPGLLDFCETLGGEAIASLEDVEEADVLLLVDADVTAAYPRVGVAVKKAIANGAKAIVIDPMETKVAKLVSLYLRPKVGTEEFLLAGLLKALLDEGLFDEKFAKTKCDNFTELKKSLNGFKMEGVEKKAGLPADTLKEAAKLYGEGKRPVVLFGAERVSPQSLKLIANLLLLTNRLKGSVLPCLLLSNLQGAVYMGALAEFYPGWKRATEIKDKFKKAWGASLPDAPGLSAMEMLEKAGSSILGMYIIGGDSVAQFPNATDATRALSSLDFLMVQDIFLSETAKLADVVLPGLTLPESDGNIVNMEHRVREIKKCVESPVQSDWKTIAELSKKMGCDMDYSSEKEIAKEIKLLFSIPKRVGKGSCRFMVVEPKRTGEKPDSKYPLSLVTGETSFGFYDGIRISHSKLSSLEPYGGEYVGVSPEDASAMGLEEGSRVRVASRRGKIEASVRIMDSLPRGLLFMPSHFGKRNLLTSDDIDPETKGPRCRLIAVSISKGGKK
ncbi:MAG: molybdopterin-dependent oxidoreductase [Actinomycetota bacterium]|nr:molybdopterin-dependent oxidoreductase [Actinomycetota bacterium]